MILSGGPTRNGSQKCQGQVTQALEFKKQTNINKLHVLQISQAVDASPWNILLNILGANCRLYFANISSLNPYISKTHHLNESQRLNTKTEWGKSL